MVIGKSSLVSNTTSSWQQLWPFGLWLLGFYVAWSLLVFGGGRWEVVKAHWPIAVAMALGSYVAGATPMGGGTIGFPVLTLLLDQPGALGRNFGLAVQSIGMVSASVYILSSRQSIDWKLLRPAMFGALVSIPLAAAFVAPYLPDLLVKLTFAVIWGSFGVMHLIKLRELVTPHARNDAWHAWDRSIGLSIGIVGGVAAAVPGVGIDMIIYAVLMLLYRSDLKIAIPTSVVLMAFSSLVGISSNVLLSHWNPSFYSIDPEVFLNWLAAAPIVALGAPFGAFVVRLISRTPTLLFVSVLCIGQFIWTIVHERVGGLTLVAALTGVVVMNGLFYLLYRAGKRTACAHQS